MKAKRRQTVALLKFLSAPAAIARSDRGYVLERAGRTHGIDADLLHALVSRGTLRRGANTIERTEAGTMALRRLLTAGDGIDAHAEQHRERASVVFDDAPDGAERVTLNLAGSPVERLARQREGGVPFLHPELVEAARRFASDFERSMLRRRITADWDAIGGGGVGGRRGGGAGDLSDSAMAARARYERARSALGEGLRAAVVDACCHAMGLEEMERRRGWPRRAGKTMLRAGLEQLALHYRAPHSGSHRMDVSERTDVF